MSFAAQETSQDSGQPIELYQWTTGSTIRRFTNSTTDQVYAAQNWISIRGLDRTQPVRKLDENALQMRVKMSIHDPNSSAFARQWIAQAPESETTLEVFQVHLTDVADELYSLFQGKVRATKYDNKTVEIQVSGLDTIFDSQGPRASYGKMCSHQHFDGRCTVNEAAFTYLAQSVTVVDPDGITFTIAGIDGQVQVDLIQGRIRLDAFTVRQIVDRPAFDQVRIKYPFPAGAIVPGTLVTVVEGCQHDLPACQAYANVPNFGGFPWGVKINPFTHSRGMEIS